ncbi:unnamed protein product [Schistosoma guineensis]|nr:unnamed protein product [Schistosoma guineensis]
MLNLQNVHRLSQNDSDFIVLALSYKLHSVSILYCSIFLSLFFQTLCLRLISYTTYVNISSTHHRTNQIATEMRRYNLQVLELSETHWTQAGQRRLDSGEMLLYSGHEDANAPHTQRDLL